ncbi:hypothetical protein KR038_005551, partial [Drosophila bunnanda]
NPSGRFFVYSPQCKIPRVDPFAKDLAQWEPLNLETCSDGPDLFSITYDRTRRRYRVNLNRAVAEKHFASYLPFGCTYIEISPGSNNSSAQSKPINFSPYWMVPGHVLGVIVECHALANASRVMQRDAFSFVQHPGNRDKGTKAKSNVKQPSIFIFGIDSMSRMNFQRTMPLTSKFVSQEGWFEMEGYNSVGDNKISNLVAILTNESPWKDNLLCDPRDPSCLHELTELWKISRNTGYLTAYAEDVTNDYFDQLGIDSIRLPVDFYMRPFLVVVEKVFKTFQQLGQCLGRRHSFSYAMDFATQLIKRYVFEVPTPLFGLFWTSSFTHNDFRGGSTLDELFVRYLEEFQGYGLFKSSIVILVSDRGARQGPLVDHPTGFLEELLPMLHIYLPRWYQQRYPTEVRALQLNKHRLSSNGDLYLGIRQFIEKTRPGIWFMEPTYPSLSIMKELSEDRSCEEASIPVNRCACEPFIRLSIGQTIEQIASVAVYRMNRYLRRLNVVRKCYPLMLGQVLKAERKWHFDAHGYTVASPSSVETYRLVFTTRPYGTMFSSMAQANNDSNVVTIKLDTIKLLSSHDKHSSCVKDKMAKKFCNCRKSNSN